MLQKKRKRKVPNTLLNKQDKGTIHIVQPSNADENLIDRIRKETGKKKT